MYRSTWCDTCVCTTRTAASGCSPVTATLWRTGREPRLRPPGNGQASQLHHDWSSYWSYSTKNSEIYTSFFFSDFLRGIFLYIFFSAILGCFWGTLIFVDNAYLCHCSCYISPHSGTRTNRSRTWWAASLSWARKRRLRCSSLVRTTSPSCTRAGRIVPSCGSGPPHTSTTTAGPTAR